MVPAGNALGVLSRKFHIQSAVGWSFYDAIIFDETGDFV